MGIFGFQTNFDALSHSLAPQRANHDQTPGFDREPGLGPRRGLGQAYLRETLHNDGLDSSGDPQRLDLLAFLHGVPT